MARQILRDLRYPNDVVERVTRLVANHMYLADPTLPVSTIKRFINRIGQDLLDDQFHLRHCDKIGSGVPRDTDDNVEFEKRVGAILAARPPLDIMELAIDGHDVIEAFVAMGYRPPGFSGGPEVGQILRALRDKVIDDPSQNHKGRLREAASVLIEALGS